MDVALPADKRKYGINFLCKAVLHHVLQVLLILLPVFHPNFLLGMNVTLIHIVTCYRPHGSRKQAAVVIGGEFWLRPPAHAHIHSRISMSQYTQNTLSVPIWK